MSQKQLYTCDSCGAKFLQWPSQVGKNHFCSKDCYAEFKKGKEPHNKGKKIIFSKPCPICGKEISGEKAKVERRKYCSKECFEKSRRNVDIESFIKKRIKIVDGLDCWFWTGHTEGGYARASINGHRNVYIHRLSYECFVGEIPEGLVLDHLCRNRSCVNPDHLEPVSLEENIRRGEAGKGPRSEEHKKAVSEANKRRFSNPESLEAQREIMKTAASSPKRLQNLRVVAGSEEYRRKQSEKMKKIWAKRKASGNKDADR